MYNDNAIDIVWALWKKYFKASRNTVYDGIHIYMSYLSIAFTLLKLKLYLLLQNVADTIRRLKAQHVHKKYFDRFVCHKAKQA